VEALNSVAGWKGGLEQQVAHDIIGGANHALDPTVLGGFRGMTSGVGHRERGRKCRNY
jgi:hypothetical protein